MDIVLGSIARPVKAIQREELPAGQVQWSTATGERSDISVSLSRLKGAYERPASVMLSPEWYNTLVRVERQVSTRLNRRES